MQSAEAPRRFKPPAVPSHRQMGDRQYLVAEGLFSGTATATHQSFFITLLVQLGIGSTALGLFSAFNGLLTNVSGLAGGRIGGRLPNRRALAALSSGIGRLGFLAIALVLILRGGDASPTLLIGIALVSATFVGLGIPVLTSMVADAVRPTERGSFFANRLLASGAGSAVVALGIAALLKSMSFPGGFTAAYLLAAFAGLGSVICLLALRNVRGPTAPHTTGGGHAAHAPISGVMWRYVTATFILWFGAAMVAPVLTPYILHDLGASAAFMGLQGALSSVIAISCQRWWGRRVDRFGAYGVLRGCTIAVATLPVLYAAAPTYWFGLGFEVVAAIGWSGYALGNLNYTMELAPEHERARYSAVANAAAGVGAFLGPLSGAALTGLLPVRAVLVMAGGVRLASFFAMRFARLAPAPQFDGLEADVLPAAAP